MRQVPKTKWRNRKIKSKWLVIISLATMAMFVHAGLVHSARAQTTAGNWVQTFSSGGPELFAPDAIQQTADGGYVLVGGPISGFNNAWVLRLDPSGNIIWENFYSGEGAAVAFSVQQTADGGFIIAGDTGTTSQGPFAAWLLRLDGDGNVVWENAYTGEGVSDAHSVQQTPDGGFIVAGGTSTTSQGPFAAWLLRLDGDGNVVWENAYTGAGASFAYSVQQTADAGFIIAGFTYGPGLQGAWVLRLDGDGNVVWENVYSNSPAAFSVRQTFDGGFVVALEASLAGAEAASVIQLDGDGNIVWQHVFSGFCAAASSVEQTSDGGFIVGVACDNAVIRLDNNGDLVWQYKYGGSTAVDSIHQTSDGGFVMAGCCSAGGTSFVAKIDSDGQVGSNCAFITASSLTQSDASYTVTPTSSTVTDTSTLDTVTPTTSTIADTSSTDTTSLICQD